MKLTAQEGGKFTLHPDGIHAGVCVDVIDRGLQPTEYGDKHKVSIVFETEAEDDDGKRQTLMRTFTASMNPKSTLYKFLGSWRGKQYAIGEEVDTDKLIGKSATLVVEHYEYNGNTKAGIASITKPQKQLASSGEYDGQALRDRLDGGKQATTAPAADGPSQAEQDDTDDDVGF